MKVKYLSVGIILFCMISLAIGQTVDAYDENKKEEGKTFFDPSKFSVNHMVSFGMSSSSQYSGMKSQSLYTTMMAYQFSKPVTLNLNFSLPIHSTYSSEFNLNAENIESLEYFKNMPLDAHLTWQPNENFAVQFSIIRNTGANPYYHSPFYSPYSSHYSPYSLMRDRENRENKDKK